MLILYVLTYQYFNLFNLNSIGDFKMNIKGIL